MTTSEPTPSTEKRGRHARSDDEPDETTHADEEARPAEPESPPPAGDTEPRGATAASASAPTAEATSEATSEEPTREAERPKRRRSRLTAGQPLGRHPAGNSLLLSAGLLLGLFLAPVAFDQLDFDVFDRAARAARSAASRWPGGGEPWFWPNWAAVLAGIVAVLLIGVAIAGVRLPDVVIAVAAVVLVATTARASWSTLAVVNARLWDLLTVSLICLLALGLAVSGLAHWRGSDDEGKGSGVAAAANSAVAGAVVALLVLVAGAGIARFQAEGVGPAGPPQAEAGLLSIRAADVAAADDLAGPWVPQVAAEQIAGDEAATAFSAGHSLWNTRFPALLLRGDDVDADDLDDSWWLTVAAQGFASEADVQGWCAGNGLAPDACVPRQLTG